ncbi:MAG: DegV family protein [Dehalococcoidales bacterium]|nr:DegV family protein [Dehalococcoidales bacterium]
MIKIVTDSSSELSPEMAAELGVTVVPIYVRFGEEVYRERVTISDEEFYKRLLEGKVHPSTIQPGPDDFIKVYEKLAREADGIISIHISAKLSGTVNSVLQAKSMVKTDCPIEVVDSRTLTTSLGLIVMAIAEAARQEKELRQVLDIAKNEIDNTHLLCLLDTLKYLQIGGRIGKAKALLGTVLNVKPLISIKDGEVVPIGQVRSRSKGLEQLFNFVKGAVNLEDVGVGYTTTLDDALMLSQRVASAFNKDSVKLMRSGTTLGVHLGPGALVVAFRGKKTGAVLP